MKKFQFFHANTVSESVLCLAGHEAAMKTGQIMALSPVHGVNTFLRHPQDPNCFNVMLLPIRMNFDRVQEEGFILRCTKCNEVVYERRFNVKQGLERPHYPEFHALKYYTECCEEFNSSEDKRICPSCGHLQDRYPIEQMGWRVYRENIGVANRGRDILSEAADSSAGASTGAPAVEARAPAPVGP